MALLVLHSYRRYSWHRDLRPDISSIKLPHRRFFMLEIRVASQHSYSNNLRSDLTNFRPFGTLSKQVRVIKHHPSKLWTTWTVNPRTRRLSPSQSALNSFLSRTPRFTPPQGSIIPCPMAYYCTQTSLLSNFSLSEAIIACRRGLRATASAASRSAFFAREVISSSNVSSGADRK